MTGRRQLEAIELRTTSDGLIAALPSAADARDTSADHAAPVRTAAFVVVASVAAPIRPAAGSAPPITSLSGWSTYAEVVALRSWTTAAASNANPSFASGVGGGSDVC